MGFISLDTTVSDLVLNHPECARVLHAHAVDLVHRGPSTLAQICASGRVDRAALMEALELAVRMLGPERAIDGRALSDDALVAHIVTTHHHFLRRITPWLLRMGERVALRHGVRHPRLVDAHTSVRRLLDWLLAHMDEEEELLFPMLLQRRARPEIIERELANVAEEHQWLGALLQDIRECTDDFTAPPGTSTHCRVWLAELEVLERDLLTHLHLENHVLLPRFAPRC